MRLRRVALAGGADAGRAGTGGAPGVPASGPGAPPTPEACVAIWDAPRERWLPLTPALERVDAQAAAVAGPPATASGYDALRGPAETDLVAFLAGGAAAREQATALADALAADDLAATFATEPALLPFEPRSLRGFATSETHWVQAARGLVRRYLPRALPAIAAYERITRRTFPMLKPGRLFYEQPSFYMGNHLTFVPDGAPLPWPSFCGDLDFELELGAVLAHPVRDATEAEGEAAIGGFVVLDDVSARDVQWREHREGVLGPLGKTKTFANAMAAEVVTAEEILPRWRRLAGRVRVNDETWSETSTAEQLHSWGAMVAHASAGEPLRPGELLSAGTLPNGCGLELDRWLGPGDELELSIDGVGTLRNRVGAREERSPRG